MGVKWPYFAKMTPPKKMPYPLPPKKTHKHPRNKKMPSYSGKKPGKSHGRLFMKNTTLLATVFQAVA
jgi:hypothetical protein